MQTGGGRVKANVAGDRSLGRLGIERLGIGNLMHKSPFREKIQEIGLELAHRHNSFQRLRALLARDQIVSKLLNAIGLMSGTSLDGIDVAYIETDGDEIVKRRAAKTYPFTPDQQAMLKDAIAEAKISQTAWRGPACSRKRSVKSPGGMRRRFVTFAERLGELAWRNRCHRLPWPNGTSSAGARLTVQLGDGETLPSAWYGRLFTISVPPMSRRAGRGRRLFLSIIAR